MEAGFEMESQEDVMEDVEREDAVYLEDEEVEQLRRERASRGRRLGARSVQGKQKKAGKVARYPVDRCLVSRDWREDAWANIVVVRRKPKDRCAVAMMLVDLGVLGLKEWFFESDVAEEEAREIERNAFQGAESREISVDLAARILEHGVGWSQKAGLEVEPTVQVAEAFLGEADFTESDEPIPLGREGKPFYAPSPGEDWEPVVEQLQEELGDEGFHYMLPTDDPEGLEPLG
jgi:hypothetical protein